MRTAHLALALLLAALLSSAALASQPACQGENCDAEAAQSARAGDEESAAPEPASSRERPPGVFLEPIAPNTGTWQRYHQPGGDRISSSH